MCDYCSKIYNIDIDNELLELKNENLSTQLVKYNNKFGIWWNCEDWYYSGIYLHNINFCPFCGKKFN